MQIIPTFASSATPDEEMAVNTALNYIDSNFDVSQNITFNMTFGMIAYGANSGTVASNTTGGYSGSFSSLVGALYAKDTAPGATAAQQAAAASLPKTDPTNGAATFETTIDQARMLGLVNTPSVASETVINLNSNLQYTYTSAGGSTGGTIAPGTYDAVGAMEHEITEDLGRTDQGGRNNTYNLFDLFRYTAAGNGTSVQPIGTAVGHRDEPFDPNYNASDQSYFSLDGKTVDLPYDNATEVANGADIADWTASVPNDSFGAGFTGQDGLISQSDIDEMQALGYGYGTMCFVTGTRIRTTRGEVSVEALAVGDRVVTASGASRPIVWLGHRAITCRGHVHPHEVLPIRVAANAFGVGRPSRDLYLSPGHPVLVGADEDNAGGHLVPIMCLINGTTIDRVTVETVIYWHVELDAHDILLAEGLPAESYLEYGDRGFFAEAADHALANPDFVVPGLAGRCRPVAIDGPVVEAERRRLDMALAMRLDAACAWPGEVTALGF